MRPKAAPLPPSDVLPSRRSYTLGHAVTLWVMQLHSGSCSYRYTPRTASLKSSRRESWDSARRWRYSLDRVWYFHFLDHGLVEVCRRINGIFPSAAHLLVQQSTFGFRFQVGHRYTDHAYTTCHLHSDAKPIRPCLQLHWHAALVGGIMPLA
jgi:hypothetical protein